MHTSKLLGLSKFQLCLCSLNIWANSVQLAEALDFSNVPPKYHKFTNVFSKTKAEVLTPHWPYDLWINLEEGAQPPVGLIYSLSVFKQKALKKFIEKNLKMDFIWLTSSLYSTPVLFVKNKDGSLHLCVNFCSLNCISKKNHYLLLLIFNLLDSFCKAWVYTNIDLCHAYHLVCIANGGEWKTAFRTHYRSFKWFVMLFGLTNTPNNS